MCSRASSFRVVAVWHRDALDPAPGLGVRPPTPERWLADHHGEAAGDLSSGRSCYP
jgi:hypothetical protein